MNEQNITPIEAINEFYRLKDKYENGFYEKYVKPIINKNKSKREKKVEFSKLPKQECINCKRNVGTLFTIRADIENNIKKFTAKCGDTENPCPFDIQINYGIREGMNTFIQSGLGFIDEIKLNIIKEKNNAIFFNKNVIGIFETLSQDLKNESDYAGLMIETNILRNDNPEKKMLLKKSIINFGKEFILPFKEMIKQYDENNNELIINQAINFYINEMMPKLKEIQEMKYDVNIVEFDEIDKIYKLIQLPISLENYEYFYKGDDKVIKFVKGIKKEKKKSRKEKIDSKNKTRKRQQFELVLEEDEEEKGQELEEEKGQELEEEKEQELEGQELEGQELEGQELEGQELEQGDIIPIFDENGNVEWGNNGYNRLWNNMPIQLKELLLQDKDWLISFVNDCYRKRKNGEPCKLGLPKNIKLPTDDDIVNYNITNKYDFNSPVINNLFDNINYQANKGYQKTLLSLIYTEDKLNEWMTKNGMDINNLKLRYDVKYGRFNEKLERLLSTNAKFDRGYF
jgi:hypothetical protein